jgi:hypothetical protein
MPTPINKMLYMKSKEKADRKFGKKTSLYKSSWMVHDYLKMGGKYKGKRDPHHGLVSSFSKLQSRNSRRRKSKH